MSFKMDGVVVWDTEIEWVFSIIGLEEIKRLRGVIEYAVETGYYQECEISCGTMNCLIEMINKEIERRKDEANRGDEGSKELESQG